jgi:hypothetical protein
VSTNNWCVRKNSYFCNGPSEEHAARQHQQHEPGASAQACF